jgi:hypothetical protein
MRFFHRLLAVFKTRAMQMLRLIQMQSATINASHNNPYGDGMGSDAVSPPPGYSVNPSVLGI